MSACINEMALETRPLAQTWTTVNNEVAAHAKPRTVFAETSSRGEAMSRYSHLSIAEREDIMVRWSDHESV